MYCMWCVLPSNFQNLSNNRSGWIGFDSIPRNRNIETTPSKLLPIRKEKKRKKETNKKHESSRVQSFPRSLSGAAAAAVATVAVATVAVATVAKTAATSFLCHVVSNRIWTITEETQEVLFVVVNVRSYKIQMKSIIINVLHSKTMEHIISHPHHLVGMFLSSSFLFCDFVLLSTVDASLRPRFFSCVCGSVGTSFPDYHLVKSWVAKQCSTSKFTSW